MNCPIARRLMESNDPSLAAHLRSCPACVLQAHARYYEAPAGLEEKIRRSLARESRAPAPWRALAMAASLLLAVSAGFNLVHVLSTGERIAEDVLSAHLRSLSGTHLLDVPSSDQHTVKPWFAGKVDFSPPVKDVAGFPLLGGRIEYLEGHPAAALVYGRRNHVINLFIWPDAPQKPGAASRRGYHLTHWPAGGMVFWAISDLNQAELDEFVAHYRQD